MNRPPDIPRVLSVDLAREPDFSIGAMRVCPSQRQILAAGHQETIQPRVMQVLVAFARADGVVLSRENLIESCWDGITVGDDAINRCIAKVRQIADFGGGPHFEIETIPRVGYRLKPAAAECSQQREMTPLHPPILESVPRPAASSPVPPSRFRPPLIAGVTAAAAIAIAVVTGRSLWPAPADTIVAVEAAGPASADFAAGIAEDLARLANTTVGLSFTEGQEVRNGDFLLKVSTRQSRHETLADAALLRDRSSDLLWTSSFASSDPTTLRQQLGNAAFRMIACVARTSSDLRHATPTSLRLLFPACERLDDRLDFPEEPDIRSWSGVVDADPHNGAALAVLALLEAERATFNENPGPLRSAALRHLKAARSINPRLGTAYAAESLLLPAWRYRERLELIDRGLAVDPDCAVLHDIKTRALQSVGMMEQAVASAHRAVELEPSSAAHRQNLISALAYGGYTENAEAELEKAERIWPDAETIHDVRFRFDLRFGDAARLIRKIDRGNAIPNASTGWQHSIGRPFLLARAMPTRENIASAVKASLEFARLGKPLVALQNLVALGRLDLAFGLLTKARTINELRNGEPDTFFRVNMRPFQLDPRFMTLADRLGLVAYWQSSQQWPDFCWSKDILYCKAEARRLRPNHA